MKEAYTPASIRPAFSGVKYIRSPAGEKWLVINAAFGGSADRSRASRLIERSNDCATMYAR
jgi:hypothetical protein